jgi:hypothetical protein
MPAPFFGKRRIKAVGCNAAPVSLCCLRDHALERHENPMPRHRPLKPELPRSEPEIIPPLRDGAYRSPPEWFSAGDRGTNRVFVARMGSWSILGIVLLIGLVAGATLAILLGTLLIALPVIGLLIAAAMISSALRSHLRRPR